MTSPQHYPSRQQTKSLAELTVKIETLHAAYLADKNKKGFMPYVREMIEAKDD